MLSKNFYTLGRVAVTLMVLITMTLVISACKKTPQNESSQTPQQAVQSEADVVAETQPAADTEPAADDQTEPAAEEKSAEEKPAEDLEPIPLVLPKPMFVGTPQNFRGITNLETII